VPPTPDRVQAGLRRAQRPNPRAPPRRLMNLSAPLTVPWAEVDDLCRLPFLGFTPTVPGFFRLDCMCNGLPIGPLKPSEWTSKFPSPVPLSQTEAVIIPQGRATCTPSFTLLDIFERVLFSQSWGPTPAPYASFSGSPCDLSAHVLAASNRLPVRIPLPPIVGPVDSGLIKYRSLSAFRVRVPIHRISCVLIPRWSAVRLLRNRVALGTGLRQRRPPR